MTEPDNKWVRLMAGAVAPSNQERANNAELGWSMIYRGKRAGLIPMDYQVRTDAYPPPAANRDRDPRFRGWRQMP